MAFSLEHWASLHAFDARRLRRRWITNPEGSYLEDLLGRERFDDPRGIWTVKSEAELVRLVGALQWHNPRMTLWFRGESGHFASAVPSRCRGKAQGDVTRRGVAWLDARAHIDRALRDRRPLARLAILQHYGCPTSLVDISASHELACAFAFSSNIRGQAHLRVFALPRTATR
jgi:hypothetical protein